MKISGLLLAVLSMRCSGIVHKITIITFCNLCYPAMTVQFYTMSCVAPKPAHFLDKICTAFNIGNNQTPFWFTVTRILFAVFWGYSEPDGSCS